MLAGLLALLATAPVHAQSLSDAARAARVNPARSEPPPTAVPKQTPKRGEIAVMAGQVHPPSGLVALLSVLLVALAAALVVVMRRYRRAEAARGASEEHYLQAVGAMQDAVWDWDLETGKVYFSSRWKEMLGYSHADPFSDSVSEWKDRLHPDDREIVLALLDNALTGRSLHFASQHRLRTRRGEVLWVMERGKILRDRQGRPVRLTTTASDITEVRLRADETERQAMYDVLTELPNRSLYFDRLEQALHAAQRYGTKLVVMVVNLNRFHEVNERHGHAAGDRVLRDVAQRMTMQLRRLDTAARLGNDEFGILLPDSDLPHAVLPMHRLLRALEQPFPLDSGSLTLAATIGVALYPVHGESADTLVQHAQVALHQARRARTDHGIYGEAAGAGHPG